MVLDISSVVNEAMNFPGHALEGTEKEEREVQNRALGAPVSRGRKEVTYATAQEWETAGGKLDKGIL